MRQFTTEFRGYDRAEVDKFVQTANDAIASDEPSRRARAQADAQAVSFRVALRGYNRREVDHYLRRIAKGRPDDRT
ncbi:DivIVA domain-containing protein [Dactylosporangium fulvum]|uniref:DivIVA domain-containing protein n=1 Tax=Dactylosporangium fulvum TaxID=53359 RepID=A0ABY5WAC2_9ACTN|nr:DivIVA domain-containing protein [Dactylosporangium fulvum]UWP85964.1 DivIVA domain-containing protein [Dactylosporangium fulvum]